MIDDLNALQELDTIVTGLLRDLDDAGRADILRRVGIRVRRLQATRIKLQKNPDGTSYEPRKRKLKARRTLHAIKFLYPEHGSGAPRLVLMKSWQYVGKKDIMGYDEESKAVRTFARAKILRYLPLDPGEDNRGAGLLKRPTVKQQAMFKKIPGPRFMRPWVTGEELNVGFTGRVARIATSHQEGLDHHPRRLLLGFTELDRKAIMDIVIEAMADRLDV